MSFEAKLIALVREHREIYDFESTGFTDRKKRYEAWDMIAQILGRDTNECKRRWRSLRDRYTRELRDPKCDGKVWRHLHLMHFLADKIRQRNRNYLFPNEPKAQSKVEDPFEDIEEISFSGIPKQENVDTYRSDIDDIDFPSSPPAPKITQTTEQHNARIEESSIKDFFKNLEDMLSNRFKSQEDDNDIMMKAIASKMKPLPMQVKLNLQMQFLQEVNEQLIILEQKKTVGNDLDSVRDNFI